jgi:hypothetical protein
VSAVVEAAAYFLEEAPGAMHPAVEAVVLEEVAVLRPFAAEDQVVGILVVEEVEHHEVHLPLLVEPS